MQNALYFENSHVRPVPLLIGVKKKFLQRILTKKKYHAPLLHWKKISALLISGKKNLSKGKSSNPHPPPPLKVKWFAPIIMLTSGKNVSAPGRRGGPISTPELF